MDKDTKIIKAIDRLHNGHYYCEFKALCLSVDDFDFGLAYLKKRAKEQYRKLAKKYHPDNNHSKGHSFMQLTACYKRIMQLSIMPLCIRNFETVLEITKGYKSTEDVVLPWERW